MENEYEAYAILHSKVKELTEEMNIAKAKVIEIMEEKGETKLDTSMGKLTISAHKTWTYTTSFNDMKDDLAAKKAQEESTGDATFVTKPSLRFTPNKL